MMMARDVVEAYARYARSQNSVNRAFLKQLKSSAGVSVPNQSNIYLCSML